MITTPLYSRNGAMPAPLPAVAYDDQGFSYTPPYADADLVQLSFKFFADVDLVAQMIVADGKGWKVVDRPAPEPDPQPEPDPYASFVPIPLLRQRLEKLGLFDDFAAYLAQYPTLMLRVLSLERGVDPAYPDILTAFDTMEVPQAARDYLMADPSVGVPDA